MHTQVLSLMDTVPYTPPAPEEEEVFFKEPDAILARIVRDLFANGEAAKATLTVSTLSRLHSASVTGICAPVASVTGFAI